MNANDERTKSLWMSVAVAPHAPAISSDLNCDTLVIGSGIAGLSCAYELAAEGQLVMVLDRGAIGGGITSRTTAHLTPICDDTISSMTKLRGETTSRFSMKANAWRLTHRDNTVTATGTHARSTVRPLRARAIPIAMHSSSTSTRR